MLAALVTVEMFELNTSESEGSVHNSAGKVTIIPDRRKKIVDDGFLNLIQVFKRKIRGSQTVREAREPHSVKSRHRFCS